MSLKDEKWWEYFTHFIITNPVQFSYEDHEFLMFKNESTKEIDVNGLKDNLDLKLPIMSKSVYPHH